MNVEALKELAAKVEENPDLLPGGLVAALDEFFPRHVVNHIAPAYNGSLDAAKALHDAVVPGLHWIIESDGTVTVFKLSSDEAGVRQVQTEITVQLNDPARAWLLAILRFLISQAQSTTEGDA